ncbi:MAG: pyridoxal phosphate-dependent aminotransferase [Candidatus Omnitrophica bacterium]|nr:pyridoxal phosphate-dependent aminotransferase [Candidatus Omnitrophota bacterium]
MAQASPRTFALAQRVMSVAPSVTLAIAAKAKEMQAQGIQVLSLSAGEPDFDTPDYIKEAAIQALQKGATKYTPATGTIELRRAIAAKLKRDQNLNFEPSQIIVGTGAKHAIFNVLFALLNEGDEVLIPSPYWLSYPEMVTVLGGRSVFLKTTEATSFKLTPDILKKGITDRSKILILNSPSNPTGAVYSRKELLDLMTVLKNFPKLIVLSDEIYEKLIFGGAAHESIASLDPEMAQRTVIVNGMSKAYSMTGWRLGYAACPNKELAEAVGSIQSHSTSNPTSFAQAGGVTALEKGEDDARKMCQVFEKRRDLLFDLISKIPGLKPFKPGGAFYLFVNIAQTGIDSVTFSNRLLQEAHVAVVPGKPFGSDEHIRLSFAASEKVLTEASTRIASWLAKK